MTDRDITLIKLSQKGDTRAFGELVANYDAKVMNLAVSLLGSLEDARDVYQEIFTKVYKSLKNYRFQSEFYTWLYRITVNSCLTYRKSRSRRLEKFPMKIEGNEEFIMSKPDYDSPDTDEALMNDEMSEMVKKAVDQLPPKQRTVIILRHYHHKKIKEIAEIMDLNEGTVKGYLFRSVRTMKDILEPYYRGEM